MGERARIYETDDFPIPSRISGVIHRSEFDYPCFISFENFSVVFEEHLNSETKKEVIPLLGVIQISVFPHPVLTLTDLNAESNLDQPAVLMLIFQNDIFDRQKVATICFTGLRRYLDFISEKVRFISTNLQKGLQILPPSASTHSCSMKKKIPKFSFEEGTSRIISRDEVDLLRVSFSKRYHFFKWRLIYTTSTDGRRISAILSRCTKIAPLILLVKTCQNSRFGAFLAEGIQEKRLFYGSSNNFVFKLEDFIRVYKPSGKNDFYVSCSAQDFIVGGSSPHRDRAGSALYFNSDVDVGHSTICETYGSPVLSESEAFSIGCLEVFELFQQF